MRPLRRQRWSLLLLLMANPALLPAASRLPEPRMTFLENDEVRIGMDLNLGGAVTFLESRRRPGNLINSADLGRQIQMSHYSGPWPFEPEGRKPAPEWAGLGWNPIQTGDCRFNPSRTLDHRNDGRELYIRCTPMQWPLDNVPGDCTFETWTTLEGPLVRMRFRCTNQRADRTFYRPCPQELPAVYTISRLSRLMSYTGDRPFSGDALTHVKNDWRKPWPWTRFIATERWAALVDDTDWGLGVFKDDAGEFHGGLHGDERSSDPKHGSTAYVAPIHLENFDHNIVYEHRTELAVGDLATLRRLFNDRATKGPPVWRFTADRQHWTLHEGQDQGFPWPGSWRVPLKPATRLVGPIQSWRAESAPTVELRLVHRGKPARLWIAWRRLDADAWHESRRLPLQLKPAPDEQRIRIRLADSAEYRGLLTGLALEIAEGLPSDTLELRSIEMVP